MDLPFIATLYGKPEERVIQELGDLIYHDPETGTWQTADAYLSGNVRAKLAEAEKAGPAYARNAEALRAVQPEDVLPGDIDANLGAPWIPEDRHPGVRRGPVSTCRPSSIQIGHLKKDAVWSIDADYQRRAVRRRHRRLRHGQGQRHLAPGAGPEPEDPGHLRHHPGTATARSGSSTRRRRLPPARSRS